MLRLRLPQRAFLSLSMTALCSAGCQPLPTTLWERELTFAFEGSPAFCDLDGDGARELLLPAAPTDHPEASYLEVVDAEGGDLVWRSADGDASFAYPLCVDADQDGTLDVVTGGRIRDVVALSGTDGTRLWTLSELYPDLPLANTYTSVATDEDPDFFVVTSGGGAPPGEPDRYPGLVLVLGRDGELLAQWEEPGTGEIYSTPSILDRGDGTFTVVLGSGGETLAGSLHILRYTPASQTLEVVASQPSACDTGGFISSNTLGDVTGDGVPEIVAFDWCSTVFVLDTDGNEVWRQTLDHPYTTGNPLLADLDGDGIYDVVANAGEFNWTLPETFDRRDSTLTALRGTDGERLWTWEVQKQLWSSPVSADYDGDGTEDVWMVATDIDASGGRPPPSLLYVLSGSTGQELYRYENASWMGTPLLDDVNGNGELDLVLVDAPFSGGAFGIALRPSTAQMLELPGVAFHPQRSFSGFRGPHHDGYRR